MSKRISNERLREIAAFTGKRHPWPYVEQMANELLALRASHAELVKALEIARMYAWPNATEEHRNIMDGTLEAARKVMG